MHMVIVINYFWQKLLNQCFKFIINTFTKFYNYKGTSAIKFENMSIQEVYPAEISHI